MQATSVASESTSVRENALDRFWLWWTEPRLELPLAMLRIVVGILALNWLAHGLWMYDVYFGTEGLIPLADWPRVWPEQTFSFFRWIHSPLAGRAIVVVALFTSALLTLGLWPRVCAAITWYVVISLQDRCFLIGDGGDVVLRLLLFMLILARSDARLSPVAPVRVIGRHDSWVIRLIQVQVAIIYCATGFAKIYGAKWFGGTAMSYALRLAGFTRADWTWLVQNGAVVNLITYSTLIFEIAFIFLIWVRRARPTLLVFGVLLHAGIELLMYIPLFSWIMCASYLSFFEHAWAERWVQVFSNAVRKRIPSGKVLFDPTSLSASLLAKAGAKADVFGVLQWIPQPAVAPALMFQDLDGTTYGGRAAWVKVAMRVPSLWPALPLLCVPGVGSAVASWISWRALAHLRKAEQLNLQPA